MPGDKVLSQAEIDALVSNVPQKPGALPVTAHVAPVSKPSSPPAQPEYDTLPARLARLESNYAIVKQELQAVLLDLREKYLEAENPFNAPAAPASPPADTTRTETRSE